MHIEPPVAEATWLLIHITLDSIACGTFSENTHEGRFKILSTWVIRLQTSHDDFSADAGKE